MAEKPSKAIIAEARPIANHPEDPLEAGVPAALSLEAGRGAALSDGDAPGPGNREYGPSWMMSTTPRGTPTLFSTASTWGPWAARFSTATVSRLFRSSMSVKTIPSTEWTGIICSFQAMS
jgi:hypothetical protein